MESNLFLTLGNGISIARYKYLHFELIDHDDCYTSPQELLLLLLLLLMRLLLEDAITTSAVFAHLCPRKWSFSKLYFESSELL